MLGISTGTTRYWTALTGPWVLVGGCTEAGEDAGFEDGMGIDVGEGLGESDEISDGAMADVKLIEEDIAVAEVSDMEDDIIEDDEREDDDGPVGDVKGVDDGVGLTFSFAAITEPDGEGSAVLNIFMLMRYVTGAYKTVVIFIMDTVFL
jgi:hypothetical protein